MVNTNSSLATMQLHMGIPYTQIYVYHSIGGIGICKWPLHHRWLIGGDRGREEPPAHSVLLGGHAMYTKYASCRRVASHDAMVAEVPRHPPSQVLDNLPRYGS